MIAAAFAVVLAQTCASMLPARDMELEWQRNGRAFARDVQLEATTSSRSYRRTLADGGRTTHTLACSGSGSNAVLLQRVGTEPPVRIPFALRLNAVRVLDGVSFRRIPQPANGAPDARWFAMTGARTRVFGVRAGGGVVEMRMQSASGDVEVFRSYVRRPTPPARQPDTNAQPALSPAQPAALSALENQIQVLTRQSEARLFQARVLEDSVRTLQARLQRRDADATAAEAALRAARDSMSSSPSPVDERLAGFLAVDVFAARGDYDAALALLNTLHSGMTRYASLTGQPHPAARRVSERIEALNRQCARAKRRSPDGACAPARPLRPFSLEEITLLLQGGVSSVALAAHVAGACITFVPDDRSSAALRAVGGADALVQAVNNACRAGGTS